MLQKMHENIKGWLASVIIGLLCFTFVLWGVQYYVGGSVDGEVIAKVGGNKITEKEVTRLVRQFQRSVGANGMVLDEQTNQQLKQLALQNLVAEAVLTSAAKKSGFVATEAEAAELVNIMPAFQQDGKFSPQKFQQFLYNVGLSRQNFLKQLQSNLLINQPRMGIEQSDFVLPLELKQYYRLTHQQRSFNYLVVPTQKFNADKVTAEQIQQYYDNNKEQFRLPEKVSIEYIELSPAAVAETVNIEPKTVKDYYESHRQSYQQPFKDVKDSIEQQLKRQKAQQKIALMNDDLTNLTFTNPDTLEPAAKTLQVKLQESALFDRDGAEKGIASNPAVVKAAFSDDVLQQGNNSDPIALPDGEMVVLRIKNHEASTVPPLANVKDQVEKHLVEQTQQAEAALLANKIEEALKSGTSPEKVAKKNQLNWVANDNIARDNKDIAQPILSAAFDLTLNKNQNFTTVAMANGDTAVVRLRNITYLNFDKATQKEKDQFEEEMQALVAAASYRIYVNNAKEASKIRIYAQQG